MQDIDKLIKTRMSELLVEHKIFDIDAYGWLNYEDADPEYVGHAMRQTSSPTEEIFYIHQDASPQPIQYPQWITIASIAGADFEGLMQSSRISIGLALFQHYEVGERFDANDSFLRVHLMVATISLSAAADRLRDLVVASIFRKGSDDYARQSSKDLKRYQYTAPFFEAAEMHQEPPDIASAFQALRPLAGRCQEFRKERNRIVHDIATEAGRQRQSLIESARQPSTTFFEMDQLEEAWSEFVDRSNAEEQQKVLNALNFPKEWYRLLIDMSNYVFLIENRLRSSDGRIG